MYKDAIASICIGFNVKYDVLGYEHILLFAPIS
jgi:hypothetical protein